MGNHELCLHVVMANRERSVGSYCHGAGTLPRGGCGVFATQEPGTQGGTKKCRVLLVVKAVLCGCRHAIEGYCSAFTVPCGNLVEKRESGLMNRFVMDRAAVTELWRLLGGREMAGARRDTGHVAENWDGRLASQGHYTEYGVCRTLHSAW
jgi:hypothetical protein